MVTGIGKYSGSTVRRRASSPKLLALNTALITATARTTLARARADHEFWARLVETAVGAHLWAHADADELAYWREGNSEVDWVVRPGMLMRERDHPVAIEVKTGHPRGTPGTVAFTQTHRGARSLIVGAGGVDVEEFLLAHPREWLQ
jgi:Zn ribbon nucleic-acid-binding protein